MLQYVLAILLLVFPTAASVTPQAPLPCYGSVGSHVDDGSADAVDSSEEWHAQANSNSPIALKQEEAPSGVPLLRDVSFGGAIRTAGTLWGRQQSREAHREPADCAIPIGSSLQVLYCRWLT